MHKTNVNKFLPLKIIVVCVYNRKTNKQIWLVVAILKPIFCYTIFVYIIMMHVLENMYRQVQVHVVPYFDVEHHRVYWSMCDYCKSTYFSWVKIRF